MPKVAAAIVAPVEPQTDERVGATLGHLTGGADNRGFLLRPHRRYRVLVVADELGGVDDLDLLDVVEPERAPRSEDADTNPVGGGQAGALCEHVKALLSAVAVEGHGHRAVLRHDYSCVWGAEGSAIRWATTSRPA